VKIGYARVSTTGQSLEAQLSSLQAEGCEEIFSEQRSGASRDSRVQLSAALQMCRRGDVLITTKLDRLARSMTDLWSIVGKLEGKRTALKVLDQPLIDTTKAEGKVVVTLLGYVAEMERQLINDRTSAGRERAMAKGVKFGRKPSLTSNQLEALKAESGTWGGSVTELGSKYGISRSSVYRLLAVS
jgi:DNA invertase Pin-like site-specific DNA recombinase